MEEAVKKTFKKRRNPIGVKYCRIINALYLLAMMAWSVITALLAYKVYNMSSNWEVNFPLILNLAFLSMICFTSAIFVNQLNGQLKGLQERSRWWQMFLAAFLITRRLTLNTGMILYAIALGLMLFDPISKKAFRPGPTKTKRNSMLYGLAMSLVMIFLFVVIKGQMGSLGVQGMKNAVAMIMDQRAFATGRFGILLKKEMKQPKEPIITEEDVVNAEELYKQASANLSSEKWDAAIEQFKKLVKIDSVAAKAHLGLGRAFLNKGDYDQAIQEAQNALDKNPNFAIAYSVLGSAYSETGDLEKGMMHLMSAIMFDPNLDEPYYYLGMIYCAKNELDSAKAKYDKLVSMNSPLAEQLKAHMAQYCPVPAA